MGVTVLLRRLKQDGGMTDKAETVTLCKNDGGSSVNAMNTQADKGGARKPSERFMRKPLQARSRASQSERIRVADLVSELEKKMRTNCTENGETKFKGYRPGHDKPAG
jgi:hypothetical protein